MDSCAGAAADSDEASPKSVDSLMDREKSKADAVAVAAAADAAEAMRLWSALAATPFSESASRSPGAGAVAESLMRGAHALLSADADQAKAAALGRAAHRLVESVAPLPAAEAAALAHLCAHVACPDLDALLRFVEVVDWEAAAVRAAAAARREAWRPLATWRALHARDKAPAHEEAAVRALALWDALAAPGAPFHRNAYANAGAKTLARELAAALSRLVTAADARGDLRRLRALAASCHVLVERGCLWSGDDVRAVLAALADLQKHPDAGFPRLLQLIVAVDAATRERRPATLGRGAFAAYVDPSVTTPLEPFAPEGTAAARALQAHLVASVRRHSKTDRVWLTGVAVSPYAPKPAFADRLAATRLGRLAAAVLGPQEADGDGATAWGADADDAYLWRYDPAALAGLPPAVAAAVATPRGLVEALTTHMGLAAAEPAPGRAAELEALAADAERSGAAKAAWFASYHLVLAPGVAVKCRDCYARDPLAQATCFATIVELWNGA